MLDRSLVFSAREAGYEVSTRAGRCMGYKTDIPGCRHGILVTPGGGFTRDDELLCEGCIEEPIRQKDVFEGIFWDSSDGD
jgi:hypothetical protein